MGDVRTELRWGPTLVVAAIVVVLAGGLPLIDGYVAFRPDERPGGGKVDIGLVGQPASAAPAATLVVADGWGTLPGQTGGAALRSAGATLDVTVVPASSDDACSQVRRATVEALASELDGKPSGHGQPLATADGLAGELAGVSSGLVDGLAFVACGGGVAVVATASAPSGARAQTFDDVRDMLASLEVG